MTNLNFGDAAGQDIRGAVQHLKSSGSPKIGVTGFCMGGALTLLSAVNVPETDAAVAWYGFPPLEYIDAAKVKAPLMGHYAIDDQAFPIGKVDELEKKLRDAKVKFKFHRYKAKHAFANEEANSKKLAMLEYNPQAAELAWKRTMASICCSPPESVPPSCPMRVLSCGKSSNTRSSVHGCGRRPWFAAVATRFSRTVSVGNTWRPSGTRPMPRRTMRYGGSPFNV